MKLFVHIPKNAGMTIRRGLGDRIVVASLGNHISRKYTDRLCATMDASGDHHGSEHARLRDWSKDLRKLHQAFAVVRNPWDRVASRYNFAKKVIGLGNVPSSYADVSSFEAFLEERHIWGGKKYYWHRAVRGWYPALDYVTDNGKIACDILRFESLDEDLLRYFYLEKPLRKRNVTSLTNPVDYRSLYTPKTIQVVGDWYADDVEAFGYDFDSGPTKNCLYL